MTVAVDEIVEAWRINQRVNLRLLEAIRDTGLRCTLSKRGGRDVARQFAHLQYVRAYQLAKRAKPLAEGIVIFATHDQPDRATLVAALDDSSGRIEEWLRRAAAGEPGFRTQKRGVVATLGYLIAHESHHRGSVLLTLKACGEPVDKDVRDAIWDWNNA